MPEEFNCGCSRASATAHVETCTNAETSTLMHALTRKLWLLAGILCALSSAAAASTVYTTLGSGDSFNSAIGFSVNGTATNPFGFVALAGASFTVSQATTLDSIRVAL